jgi:hypothetical protein
VNRTPSDASLACASIRGVSSETVDDGEPVEIRAFRGTRRSSVYREYVLSEGAFARILDAGERMGLPLLASLHQYGPHELDKRKARQLAGEATSIRASAELPDLDDDLTSIAEVARWCARATDDSWLKIARS